MTPIVDDFQNNVKTKQLGTICVVARIMGRVRVTTTEQRSDDGFDGGRVPFHAPNIENRRASMLMLAVLMVARMRNHRLAPFASSPEK